MNILMKKKPLVSNWKWTIINNFECLKGQKRPSAVQLFLCCFAMPNIFEWDEVPPLQNIICGPEADETI